MESRKAEQKQVELHDYIEQEDNMNRTYFWWDLEKEKALANILRHQRSMGNKVDTGWKSIALRTASRLLSSSYKMQITPINVRNCMRTWKRCYATVTDILSHSEFNWDDTKHMIMVENEQAWNAYVKSHEDAKKYRWKVIPNWEDIVDLCAQSPSTGKVGEMVLATNEVIVFEKTNDLGPPSKKSFGGEQSLDDHTISSSSARGKKRKKLSSSTTTTSEKMGEGSDTLAAAMIKMVATVEVLMKLRTQKVDPKDVYDQVFEVVGLTENEKLKACAWFVEHEKQFAMLNTLPTEKKKDFILVLI